MFRIAFLLLTCCTGFSSIFQFSNTNSIDIPNFGEAWPYPSTVTVTGITEKVTRLQIRLAEFSHDSVGDISVVLVAPSGRAVSLIAGVDGMLNHSTIVFDDSALTVIGTDGFVILSEEYRPSGGGSPPVGTDGPTGMDLLPLATSDVNGEWKLYIEDLVSEDSGYIDSWSLILETGKPAPRILLMDESGHGLADGMGKNFGGVLAGTSTNRTFTIKNVGTADLVGIRAMVTGGDSNMFRLASSPAAVLPPFSNTSFIIEFTPRAGGQKTTTLSILIDHPQNKPLSIPLAGSGDVRIVKADWTVEGPFRSLYKAVVDGKGDVFVAGYTNGGGQARTFLTKCDANSGKVLWELQPFTNSSGSPVLDMAVDANGDLVVSGFSLGVSNFFACDTLKIQGATGKILWQKRYDDSPSSVHIALAVDRSGNAIVTGCRYGGNGTTTDLFAVKYASSNGEVSWQQHYNGPGSGDDCGMALAADSRNDVIVVGNSQGTYGNSDIYTAKYRGDDGVLLWERRYNGPATDNAVGLALDATDNVVVTGNSLGNDWDFYTAKYAGQNGAILWERRYSDAGDYSDVPGGLVTDDVGNVFVTGFSTRSSTNGNESVCYTAKYAAADGSLIWEQRLPGTGFALGFTTDRDVLIFGASREVPYSFYFATCDPVDGRLLSRMSFGGSPVAQYFYPRPQLITSGDRAIVVVSSTLFSLRRCFAGISVEYRKPDIHVFIPGLPGETYGLQRAASLDGAWTTIGTPAAPDDGLIDFIDENPPAGSAFYRTLGR